MRNKTSKVGKVWRGASAAWGREIGFTLVEMLMALAVLAILAMQAIPSMAAWVSKVRLSSAADQFFQSLALARNEAIKRNTRTVVCKSAAGSVCDLTGSWQWGWIVFVDVNGNAQVDDGDQILFRQAALGGNIRFDGNTNVAKYVSYSPNGTSKMVGGAVQMGTFTICMASGTPTDARKLMLSKPGQVRVEKTVVESCQ